MATESGSGDVPMIERKSLCLSSNQPGIAAHCGEQDFNEGVMKNFAPSENDAAEKVVRLKTELRDADGEVFWQKLMEGMTDICDAQYSFVAKRILVDDPYSAVEMPSIGETGSCLLGVAFYWNDGSSTHGYARDYKYLGWSCPCAHMRHDKVFLIPENLSGFITNNPNSFPFPCESYLGIPLFSEGKCFAHFGLMWTQAGMDRKKVSWGYTEMTLHSLEDIIREQLLRGQGFAKLPSKVISRPTKVIPQNAITASQSLKPYARSLSHELRTPMQGVVGMLDVMHATVQEAIETQPNMQIRNTFQALRENIEVVQDSSRRAVEAADNVVHAYDLNMQIPDTPQNESESPATNLSSTGVFENRVNKVIEGSNIPVTLKRRRSSPVSWHFGNPLKQRDTRKSPRREGDVSPRTEVRRGSIPNIRETQAEPLTPSFKQEGNELYTRTFRRSSLRNSAEVEGFPTPGLKYTNIRDVIPQVIHESLHVGGRPDSAITEPMVDGERIEVRSRSSNGECSQKTVEWSVDPDIPETLLVDERDLAKLISCIFLNAIKFTEAGLITIKVHPGKSSRFILINVMDTGPGIPKDFQPELFKPFSREDDSLTRSKEGLGLGLMVAKGIARRIGGDLNLVHSEIDGPDQGSEFEIKVPVDSAEGVSRPDTPRNLTPTPSLPPKMPVLYPNSKRSPRASSPLHMTSPSRQNTQATGSLAAVLEGVTSAPRRSSLTPLPFKATFDRRLAERHPLTFLVAEDNKINRKLLVNMLSKFGYKDVYEAYDGTEAVRIMTESYLAIPGSPTFYKPIDVVLMDLWMPEMDGYEATERILDMFQDQRPDTLIGVPTILAVSADVTEEAIDRATRIGMEGFMTKPYKLTDLQRLIEEFCVKN